MWSAYVALWRAAIAVTFARRGSLLRSTTERRATSAIVPAERIACIVTGLERASRYGMLRPNCLVRSLALRDLLHREGVDDVQMCVGVRTEHGQLSAHAWIEHQGVVLGDRQAFVDHFMRLPVADMMHAAQSMH